MFWGETELSVLPECLRTGYYFEFSHFLPLPHFFSLLCVFGSAQGCSCAELPEFLIWYFKTPGLSLPINSHFLRIFGSPCCRSFIRRSFILWSCCSYLAVLWCWVREMDLLGWSQVCTGNFGEEPGNPSFWAEQLWWSSGLCVRLCHHWGQNGTSREQNSFGLGFCGCSLATGEQLEAGKANPLDLELWGFFLDCPQTALKWLTPNSCFALHPIGNWCFSQLLVGRGRFGWPCRSWGLDSVICRAPILSVRAFPSSSHGFWVSISFGLLSLRAGMQKSGICSLFPFPSLPGPLAGGSLTLAWCKSFISGMWTKGRGQQQQDLCHACEFSTSLGLELEFVEQLHESVLEEAALVWGMCPRMLLG